MIGLKRQWVDVECPSYRREMAFVLLFRCLIMERPQNWPGLKSESKIRDERFVGPDGLMISFRVSCWSLRNLEPLWHESITNFSGARLTWLEGLTWDNRGFFSGNVWKGCLIRYAKTSGREARFSVTSKNWTEFSTPPPPPPPVSGLEKDVFEAQSTFEYLTLARERRFS